MWGRTARRELAWRIGSGDPPSPGLSLTQPLVDPRASGWAPACLVPPSCPSLPQGPPLRLSVSSEPGEPLAGSPNHRSSASLCQFQPHELRAVGLKERGAASGPWGRPASANLGPGRPGRDGLRRRSQAPRRHLHRPWAPQKAPQAHVGAGAPPAPTPVPAVRALAGSSGTNHTSRQTLFLVGGAAPLPEAAPLALQDPQPRAPPPQPSRLLSPTSGLLAGGLPDTSWDRGRTCFSPGQSRPCSGGTRCPDPERGWDGGLGKRAHDHCCLLRVGPTPGFGDLVAPRGCTASPAR